jgi:hypothetical protein
LYHNVELDITHDKSDNTLAGGHKSSSPRSPVHGGATTSSAVQGSSELLWFEKDGFWELHRSGRSVSRSPTPSKASRPTPYHKDEPRPSTELRYRLALVDIELQATTDTRNALVAKRHRLQALLSTLEKA